MHKRRLKIKTRYGMSSHSKAWRPHLIDHERSAVRIYEGEPEHTFYEIKFYCGPVSPRQHVIPMTKLPDGVEICRACERYKAMREYHLILGRERLQYKVFDRPVQVGEAPF